MTCIDTVATGTNIKTMMQNNGFTVKDIRNACGLSTYQAVYKWFRGITLPTVDNMVILAELFGCTVSDILVVVER